MLKILRVQYFSFFFSTTYKACITIFLQFWDTTDDSNSGECWGRKKEELQRAQLIAALSSLSNVSKCISQNWAIIMISTQLQLRKQRHMETKNLAWYHRQQVAGLEFVASLSRYNQTPTEVLQSLVCDLRWSHRRRLASPPCIWAPRTRSWKERTEPGYESSQV